MKVAMMTYTMSRPEHEDFDPVQLCEFTRELDIEAIDWVRTYGYDPEELKKITDDYGLKNCAHTFFCDLNFPTPEERADGRDDFKRGIEAAAALGAPVVMLPVSGKEAYTREESRQNYLAGLKEVIGFAEEAGITVTVENFPSHRSPFIISDDLLAAIEEVPQLRITFDNGNVTTGGESAPESFRKSAEYVVHSHLKDWEWCDEDAPGARIGLDGKYRRATLVGDGYVDQPGCIEAMAEYGYDGYINFEYEGSELSPREATIEGVRRMRQWIAEATE